MSSLPPDTFASLLRHYRKVAGLTQEELAERARLSVQAIGALERGDRRAPHKETIDLLAEALALTKPERAVFEAIAHQRRKIDQTAPRDLIRADISPLVPADETAGSTEPFRQQEWMWSASLVQTVRSLALRSGRRLPGGIVGVLLIALLGSALLLRGEPGAGAVPGLPQRLCGGTLALATDFPTSGLDGHLGKSVENAVDLAVIQNRDLGGGYSLKVIHFDDESATGDGDDPARGARNVTSMVKDACIVGMVGPIDSDAAQPEMPIAANAGLVMISPSNTNPGLTLRPYAGESLFVPFDQLHPAGKTTNYFRDIANDAFQMAADADFTFDRLAARRVYVVVSRPSRYGELLVGGFTSEFLGKGGTIVATESLEWHNPAAFPALAAKIAAAAPDAVYFGGTVQGGGPMLKQQLFQHGYTGPFVSGDGIANDPAYIDQAGAGAAQNTYATLAEPDVTTFTAGAGAKFLRDYRTRYPSQQVNGDCANAFDAAMIEITAIKNLIRRGQAVTRAAVIDQVQNIQYTGVTGAIRFDKNGDDVHGVYTVYTVQDGAWVAYEHVTV